jgi:hypothetical protein
MTIFMARFSLFVPIDQAKRGGAFGPPAFLTEKDRQD